MVTPVIAIVGRPNVGKSALFNRLVGRRQALVRDVPGVTRDRLYGVVSFGRWQATIVDTGGFDPVSDHSLTSAVRRQVLTAIEEAHLILFVVDARAGMTPLDQEIARTLRRCQRPVVVVANKIDSAGQDALLGEFFALGFPEVLPVSAEHGRGVATLLDAIRDRAGHAEAEQEPEGLRVAIIGRPNVGKSSLVNRLLGEERAVVSETPGTTRDSIDTPVRVGEREYLLIDTAGIRRRGKVDTGVEHLSVHFALKGLSRADVVVLLIDGKEGVTAQDAHIAGQIVDAGAGCVLAVNKWDAVPPERKDVKLWTRELREQMKHVTYAPVLTLSALTGLRVDRLFGLVDRVAAERAKRVDTTDVNRFLEEVTERTPPPSVRGRDIRIYYATQASVRPPTFVFFVNRPGAIHFSYQRFLANQLRKRYGFEGTPLRLVFRHRSGRWEDTRSGRAPSFKR